VFDLSFRRQGSLLVYDPDHLVPDHILNSESLINGEAGRNGHAASDPLHGLPQDRSARTPFTPARVSRHSETGQAMIVNSIDDISVGRKAGSLRRKRRLIEMSGVDGAVVFDDDRLIAVGALIRSHPEVGNHLGARATAARSAYLWGGRPIKVSSDGDVTIHFKSRSGSDACDAVMHFL
jgi:hypothetical protein